MTPETTCPPRDRWPVLLDGSASEDERARLVQHLDECPRCGDLLQTLAGGTEWPPDSENPFDSTEKSPEPGLAAAMEELKSSIRRGETPTRPSPRADAPLDFLSPSNKPGYVGVFGPYEIIDMIGRGGMGIVLKGYDSSLRRTVAVKVLAPHLAAVEDARTRFLREARAAAAVVHDHVVPIYAVDEAAGLPYLVMQYVAGGSLQEEIERRGTVSVEEIVRIGIQVAKGLEAAHRQAIVHRDIKPANILLEDGTKNVKITDFGLARAGDDVSITQTGTIAGTPQYMSPEQCRGERVDGRSDLYSLGCVLYTLGVGHPPFQGDSVVSVVHRVCEESPPPIRPLNPEMPPWLAQTVEKLLAKTPSDRFASGADLATALRQRKVNGQETPETGGSGRSVTASVEVAADAPRPIGRTRRRWLAVGTLLLLGGFILTEAIGLTSLRNFFNEESNVARRDDPPPPPPPAPVPPQEEILVYGPSGGKPRVFETLGQAIPAAKAYDVIEIRQNGVIPVHPMQLDGRPLTIRAGQGFLPVLTSDRENTPLILTDSRLVLEGLVLRMKPTANERLGGNTMGPEWRDAPPAELGLAIVSRGAPLYLANCRIVQTPGQGRQPGISCIYLDGSPECELRNCLLLSPMRHLVGWNCPPGGSLTIQNVVGSSRGVVEVLLSEGSASLHLKPDVKLQMQHGQ